MSSPDSIVLPPAQRWLSPVRLPFRSALASALWLSACGTQLDATTLAIDDDDAEVQGTIASALSRHERNPAAALGELIFNDTRLSSPAGQACGTCHAAELAFTDPDTDVPTSQGVLPDRFGVRNSPMATYASFVPPLHVDPEEGLFVGGLFLDGRVDTLEEQAGKPFLNPLEMNNADPAEVVSKLRRAPYRRLFQQVYGRAALEEVEPAYERMTRAIAAFERTSPFRQFSSKYDAYLAGEARLTRQERWGLALFEDSAKGNCAACHPSALEADGSPPQFTDFTYDNIGMPKNPDNPFYVLPADLNPEGPEFVDRGLGTTVGDAAEDGKFRVSSLRNVALTAPYGHNGFFPDLRSVVQFYNTRDVAPWPAAEVPETMNVDELGNLGLSEAEVDALVAFLETLTDGYRN
jgi:cytochrome c peroxidase